MTVSEHTYRGESAVLTAKHVFVRESLVLRNVRRHVCLEQEGEQIPASGFLLALSSRAHDVCLLFCDKLHPDAAHNILGAVKATL